MRRHVPIFYVPDIVYIPDIPELPADFLIPQRHEGGRCPNCGGEVQRIDISGRSAYYCPTCQKRA